MYEELEVAREEKVEESEEEEKGNLEKWRRGKRTILNSLVQSKAREKLSRSTAKTASKRKPTKKRTVRCIPEKQDGKYSFSCCKFVPSLSSSESTQKAASSSALIRVLRVSSVR